MSNKNYINFKIISNKNENVYCEGYVTINDKEGKDAEWYYWTGNGYQERPFYHHNKEKITGLTDIQDNEIDTFKIDHMNNALWIDTYILQSKKDEKKKFVRKNCTIIINGDE